MTKEEIQKFIQSAVSQAAHLQMAPETTEKIKSTNERIARIEQSLLAHTKEERDRDEESRREMNKRLDKQDSLLEEVLQQVKKTNGRVTTLEDWKTATVNFARGVNVGGKSVWIGIATVVGIAWVVFGDLLKSKVGLK